MLLLESIESVRMSRDPPGPPPLLFGEPGTPAWEAASIFFASRASISERGREELDDSRDIFFCRLLWIFEVEGNFDCLALTEKAIPLLLRTSAN